MGEVAWTGRGSLGRDDGRVVLYRPGRELLRPTGPPDGVERPDDRRSTSGSARTSAGAAPRSTASCSRAARGRTDREVLDALWDLVWAGEVTNDTFAPLRALRWKRPAKDSRPRPEPADVARAARGGRPLVARRRRDRLGRRRRRRRGRGGTGRSRCAPGRHPDRAGPCPGARAARTPRRAHPRGGRRARRSRAGSAPSTRCCARSRRAAGSVAATSSTGWAPRSSPCPGAVDRLRAMRDQPGRARRRARPGRPPARRRGSRRTRTAPPWPGRAAPRPTAGRSSVRRAPTWCSSTARRSLYLERGGSTLQVLPAGDDPETRAIALGALRDLVADGRVRELVIGKVDGEPVAHVRRSATTCSARGSSPATAGTPSGPRRRPRRIAGTPGRRRSAPRARPMPEGDTLFRTAAGLRPYLVGRTVDAARARQPGPQADRLVGATVTGVEAQGKNLLIRFDNGLEIRTHLGMHGSWHRYRPGERWRRPPARARLVLEVPGRRRRVLRRPDRRAVRAAGRGAAPEPAQARAGPARSTRSTWTRRFAGCATPSERPPTIGEALLDQRALAGIGNEVRNQVLWEARVSPFRRSWTWTTRRSASSSSGRARSCRRGRARAAGPATSMAGPAARARAAGRSSGRRRYGGSCRGSPTGARTCQPDPRSESR